MIEMGITTGQTLALDVNQQDIPINPTPMHRECIGNLIINKIIHCHFHHFHEDNLADGTAMGSTNALMGLSNPFSNWDAICQGVPMQQTLAMGTTNPR